MDDLLAKIPEVTDYVLKRLKEHIPNFDDLKNIYGEDYIIAGGSVANIIYEYFTGIPAVIKDIDIFYQTNENSIETIEDLNLIRSAYQNIRFGNGVYIRSIKECGILNIIETNKTHYNVFQLSILENFDLNCVQVGISKNILLYTDNFIKFISNKKIKICNISNYISTISRIFKKQRDLQLNVDNDELMFVLSQLIYHYSSLLRHFSHYGNIDSFFYNFISYDFYDKKIEPFKELFEKYFFIFLVKTDDIIDQFTLFPKIEIDNNFQKLLPGYIDSTLNLMKSNSMYATTFSQFFERCSGKNIQTSELFLSKFQKFR